MAKETGGPAFPEHLAVTPMGDTYSGETGMTLRDYFAAHAPKVPDLEIFPQKFHSKLEVVDLGDGMKGPRTVAHYESWAERSARWAGEHADAMLAERSKP